MFDASKYVVAAPKPLPVILLLDVSGSMDEVIDPENCRRTGQTVVDDGKTWEIVTGGTAKRQLLNMAVTKMIQEFSKEERTETEFLVSVITFGVHAKVHLPFTKASNITWEELSCGGDTSLGEALKLAKAQIENREIIPSRSYRPTVVLVTDGEPTDDWEEPMRAFIQDGRSSKCFCMAMGIKEKDEKALGKFIAGTPTIGQVGEKQIPNKVFHCDDAENIMDFFQKVTMSITTRSRSTNPNQPPSIEVSDEEDEASYF